MLRPLLRLLSKGEPVTAEDLAETTDRPADVIRQSFATLPGLELDELGRVVGYGLTLRPTQHRFETDGHQLFTWCALDTLVFPAILGRVATIESPCHSTNVPVRVTVGPTGVTDVDPATAVVSIVIPSEQTNIRAAFCDHVHFFATPTAAAGWLADHPGMAVYPVVEAHQLGLPLVTALLAGE